VNDWLTPEGAAKRWPHLKLSAPYRAPDWRGPSAGETVSIAPGCNCVLLTTFTQIGEGAEARTHYGSYGDIEKAGSIFTKYVEAGALTDLRSFVPFYRTFPKNSPPGTPAIPDSWERWLDACERAFAAFEAEPK